MREIGGYIELDKYHLPIIHEKAIALNCGRNALAYILRARKIKKIWLPKLICDSVTDICKRENVQYCFYKIGADFYPLEHIDLGENELFYFVNYYSQFDNNEIMKFARHYQRMIVDNVHDFFLEPIPGVDTIYSCRKYFGVPDGAFLYSDMPLNYELPLDISYDRMSFLLGRYEKTASEFYRKYVDNNNMFKNEPIKRMSKLTSNLLHGIDYEQAKKIREGNFDCLHKALARINGLNLNNKTGNFMYPLYIKNGKELKKVLHTRKIYVPTFWPSVFNWCCEKELEYRLAENILPLPIDQRYGTSDMEYLTKQVYSAISELKL